MSESKRFEFNSYLNNIQIFADVIKQMKLLDRELVGSDLENLRPFNTTYLIITEAVASKSATGYFHNPQQMQLFDIVFAKYYFNALHGYCHGESVDQAWFLLFERCKQYNLLQIQYMALGVNAHVNNDLALALADMIKNDREDYLKINNVINTCIPQVLKSIREQNTFLEVTKNNGIIFYHWILLYIIKNWRNNAWENHLKLKNNKSSDDLKKHAVTMANYLSILHSNTI